MGSFSLSVSRSTVVWQTNSRRRRNGALIPRLVFSARPPRPRTKPKPTSTKRIQCSRSLLDSKHPRQMSSNASRATKLVSTAYIVPTNTVNLLPGFFNKWRVLRDTAGMNLEGCDRALAVARGQLVQATI